MYYVKEIFYSIQGEGYHSGRPAVFCRFSGCNLWSGKEKDRKNSPCPFCDTDFTGTDGPGGGEYSTAHDLVSQISRLWPSPAADSGRPFVVCTGGEPLLQLDAGLIAGLHKEGFEIAVETNGTIAAPEGIDWICVSPKARARLVQVSGDELKLVYPQEGMDPEEYASLAFRHFFLQPLDGPGYEEATVKTLKYVLEHPAWWISLQLHKILNVR
jgi:7-carboxy-7-deazaguanine synthase (Cx14CxxC type)